jgi:serine/threonine-protein kinase HipA
MPGALEVWLSDDRVGTFTNLPGDYNLFAFDEAYLEDENSPVLSQSLIAQSGKPIRRVPRTHRVAPPFFANLLPDEDGLLRGIIARQYNINRTRDYPFLQTLGLDLPGAVITRSTDPLMDEGQELDKEHVQHPLRFSLAGAQLKFSASMVANRLTLPLNGLGGYWIVKIPTNAFPRLPENEFAIMGLAKALGLNVPQIELVDLDQIDGLPQDLPGLRADEPRKAYAIRRFDRGTDGARIHFEDLNQIAGQAPADKYEHKATHWVANVVSTLCPAEDLDEFVRRLVFGICIGNNDMHLKNWSVGYPDRRNARIAPLYDYVCSRLYYPKGQLALTVGGEREFERVDEDTLRAFANAAEISARRTLVVAGDLVERLHQTWPTFRSTISDPSLTEAVEKNLRVSPLMKLRGRSATPAFVN